MSTSKPEPLSVEAMLQKQKEASLFKVSRASEDKSMPFY